MPETVAAYILKPGIHGEKGAKLEVGARVPVNFSQLFQTENGGRLHLTANGSGNRARARVWERLETRRLPSLLTSSQDVTPRVRQFVEDVSWGDNPHEGSTRMFGAPQPALRAEYLGHPLRDVLNPYMDAQSENFDPTRGDQYSEHNRVLFVGNVIHADHIYGVTDSTEDFDLRGRPDFTYPGAVMIGATLSTWNRQQNLTVFAATRADADGLMRVRTVDRISVNHERPDRVDAALEALAELSLYAQQPTTVDQPELSGTFPLLLVDYVGGHDLRGKAEGTKGADRISWGYLQNQHGIDWPAVVQDLPQSDVQTEKARLTDIYRAAVSS